MVLMGFPMRIITNIALLPGFLMVEKVRYCGLLVLISANTPFTIAFFSLYNMGVIFSTSFLGFCIMTDFFNLRNKYKVLKRLETSNYRRITKFLVLSCFENEMVSLQLY
jgi:hypothetical protein